MKGLTMIQFDPALAKATPGYWYVGSPYSKFAGGIDAAFEQISAVTAGLLRLGIGVFSPIAHSHPVAMHGALDPHDHSVWLPADRPLMDAACGLIVVAMPGWGESYGLSHEIDVFEAAGKTILYLPPEIYEPLLCAATPGERDPNGKRPHEAGAKLDDGKAPVFRGALGYFPRALTEVANVSQIGARKYCWGGWEHVPDGAERYTDALARHLLAETSEGATDPATGLSHAAQVAWNALARLELMLRAAR